MKIALYQMNTIVGDLAGNAAKLFEQIQLAKLAGADLFIAPELALCGYPPEDLLLRPAFYQDCQRVLDKFLAIDGITLVIGCPVQIGTERFNSVYAYRDGMILGRYDKMLLPNYGVFDECRYFTPGVQSLVIPVAGSSCGVVICEDAWDTTPIEESCEAGAELIIVLNASPFEAGKHAERLKIAAYRVAENHVPLVYVNQIGGQDELVFDGASFALAANGELRYQAVAFQEELAYLDYAQDELQSAALYPYPSLNAQLYAALVLALHDYVVKNGFPGVLLGLSGGIDSALTLAIAFDALGAERVISVMLPTRYTADISISDAQAMVEQLGVRHEEIAIEGLFENYLATLAPLFAGKSVDTTEENLQARIRGTILMALSNKFGHLVVTTGNKSEMTTGYATLYGDMAGGFALLKDLTKTQVYALANWRNQQSAIIPERIITRPPSAELRADQCDQNSLPDYAILDAILVGLVEERRSSAELIASGYLAADVARVAHLLKINEYKRRQAAVGPKLSASAFARDWRYPNTHKFKF